ncbi:MAG: sigma-70 family RNA polymerase sigma factor [Betaproteobacteria bacterium]|nr:sigma-70 family RNA polymerase sigma factor [Betaproteobacteria bacterium]
MRALDSELLKDHTRYLTAYALRRVSDRSLAEDLVQDTFLAALSAEVDFEGRSSLRTWLTGILKHKIADVFRARVRLPLSLEALRAADDEPIELGIAANGEHFDFGGDPHKQLEHKRFCEAFQRELGRMPERTAEAFMASEFTLADSDEVCERFGMSPGSLWVMRCRTRAALRRVLAPALAA